MAGGFQVRFVPSGVVVPVATARTRRGPIGEAGSLLDLALSAGVAIESSCGGIAGCATCHCVVLEGAASLAPPADDELKQLPNAVGRRDASRLACQAVPDGSCDLVVEIPPLE